jgi:hypothetical protein
MGAQVPAVSATAGKALDHPGTNPPAKAAPEPQFLSRFTNAFDRELAIALVNRLAPDLQRKMGYDPRDSIDTNQLQAFQKLMARLTNNAAPAPGTRHSAPQPKPAWISWLEDVAKQREQADAQARVYEQRWPRLMKRLAVAKSVVGWGMIAACLLLYLYVCHCCRQLCWRTGTPARVLIWLPRFKRLTFFRATGVSNLWFWLGWLIPFVGFTGWVLCCWRLCDTFQKSKWLTLAMVCPLLGWIAFICLASATLSEDEEIAVKRLRAGYAF